MKAASTVQSPCRVKSRSLLQGGCSGVPQCRGDTGTVVETLADDETGVVVGGGDAGEQHLSL